jgi:hypothetical protein
MGRTPVEFKSAEFKRLDSVPATSAVGTHHLTKRLVCANYQPKLKLVTLAHNKCGYDLVVFGQPLEISTDGVRFSTIYEACLT